MSKIIDDDIDINKMIEEENYMARKEKISWIRKEQKRKCVMETQIIKNLKQRLLDFNFEMGEGKSNFKFMTINCVIQKWEEEFNSETDKTNKEKRNALFDDLDNFWNKGYKIGEASIKSITIYNHSLMARAINELYDDMTIDYEYGDRSLYPTFADKLDFIYYKQAEKEFIKTIKKNKLEKKKKKRKRLVIID